MMIYFDNAASLPPHPQAVLAAQKAMEQVGNPSSPHFAGINAATVIAQSRKHVADALSCQPSEVFFTSSGTESNNLAIFALARKNRRAGDVILTAASEHPSVIQPVKALAAEGFKVVYVPVTGGEPDYAFLENAFLKEKVCLASFMWANNQNGALTDLSKIRSAMVNSRSRGLFHTDAVQGFLKTPREYNAHPARYADAASFSAHKIGGIKGTGGLFVKSAVGRGLKPIITGGGQESGFRSGTENLSGIAAFGEAVRLFSRDETSLSKVAGLRKLFLEKAKALLGDNIDFRIPGAHIDSLVNISLKGVKSEVAGNYLSSKGICVSSSSACSSKAKKNEALAAFSYGKAYSESSLRISFSPFNTEEEVEILVSELKNALQFTIPSPS